MFLKHYDWKNLKNDIPAGILAALISIPVSMGHAQIAGLPAVYGLYGSILPTIIFALITESPHFYFGFDGAPAIMMGGVMALLGLVPGSELTISVAATVSFMTGLWLVLFAILDFGKIAKFVSTPVMGGFISGVAIEIILIQLPQLFGGRSEYGEHGELPEILHHIWEEAETHFEWNSLVLGLAVFFAIVVGKKVWPRVPVVAIVLLLGMLSEPVFHLSEFGVSFVTSAEGYEYSGMPAILWRLFLNRELLLDSLMIAVVIMSESLLDTQAETMKHDGRIHPRRELAAYAAATLSSSISGTCPPNGSPSRSALLENAGGKTQMVSVVSGIAMFLFAMFGRGTIHYIPVPVMTGIIIAALYFCTDFKMAIRLIRIDKIEFCIFWIVFLAVLMLGVIPGMLVGLALSCLTVILRQSKPADDFLGVLPGGEHFLPIQRTERAEAIKGVVIFRFQAALFFANCTEFRDKVEAAIKPDTEVVIIDASGIGSVDLTAVDQLMSMWRTLKKRNIRFFFTGHPGSVNDQIRTYEGADLFRSGVIIPDIRTALLLTGRKPPYETEHSEETLSNLGYRPEKLIATIEWAFGKDAEKKVMHFAHEVITKMIADKNFGVADMKRLETEIFGHCISKTDEDELFSLLRMYASIQSEKQNVSLSVLRSIEEKIEKQQLNLDRQIIREEGEAGLEEIMRRRLQIEKEFEIGYPELHKKFAKEKEYYLHLLEERQPKIYEQMVAMEEKLEEAAEEDHN